MSFDRERMRLSNFSHFDIVYLFYYYIWCHIWCQINFSTCPLNNVISKIRSTSVSGEVSSVHPLTLLIKKVLQLMYPIYTQRLQPVRVFKSVDRSSISTPTGLLEFQQLKPIRQLIQLLSYPILLFQLVILILWYFSLHVRSFCGQRSQKNPANP